MKKNLYTKKDNLNCSNWEKTSYLYQIICLLFFFIALSQTANAQISGAVYRDFNEDGVRSFTTATPLEGEIGVGGVTVNVYNAAGTLAGTTVTSSATATAGSYTATVSGTGPFRVEFVNLPTGYFDGLHGTASGTSVQFVASSPTTGINLGINYPFDYCQAAPNFLVPCYVNGDPTGGGNAGTQGVLVTLPYSSTGNTPAEFAIATNVQIGTVYGVAYQRTAKTIFTSAFVKRHSGLGTGGAGAIYITKPGSGTTYTSSLFTTLPTAVTAVSVAALGGSTVVGDNTARSLPSSTTVVNYDATTYDQVGKAGLGDIELSEDGTQLYAVNLGDRRLYQIPVNSANTINPTAGTPVSFTLPTVIQATGSVLRPFALKVYRGRVYIGAVTTNEAVSTTVNSGTGSTGTTPLITRDPSTMVAYVFEFNPVNSSFTTVLSFPLSYTKGASDNDQTGVSRADRWYPWTNVLPAAGQLPTRFARNDLANCSYPQPMLSGIEFDVDGSMILSIRDRFGDQYGNNNYGPNSPSTTLYRAIAPGDILRAGLCTPGVNLWTLESNARVCSGPATLGANTNQGPGGGEYYYSDGIAIPSIADPYHSEMSEGGLALFPGTGEVSSIALDPTTLVDAGGIRRFKNSDGSGSPSTSVQIYASSNVATYGKANGLGDLEINCDLPPIQIGNRVFRDVNNNGVQDPGEPGLAGVQVILRGPSSTTIAVATTDANGEYYFSSATSTSTTSSITNLTLTAGGSYTLSFPTSVSAFTISALPNSATGTNSDAIDSDPSATGIIAFTLGSYGENNFTYDAGYACTPLVLTLTSGTICAGQTVSLTATSGFSSYTFSTGLTQVGTTNVASGSVNGTYSVTALNSSGCSGTATGSITVNALPIVTLSSATICTGQSATLTATSGLTNYTFSTGLTRIGTTNQATGTTAGTYSVTAVNSVGCTGVSSGTGLGTIIVNTPPVVTLSSVTICAGQTATLTATAGLSSYTFSSGLVQVGATNQATGTTAGTYSVTATNSVGCSATATGTITVNPVPALTLSSATICAGQTATLVAGGTGFATYTFSTGLTQVGSTSQATGTTAGTYSVTATTALGCSTTATGTITVNSIPALTLSSATICAGQTATLTAGGTGFATYVFSAGLTHIGATSQATGTTAGTYSVTATTALGCSTTATGTITVNPVPALTLSSATICAGQTTTLTAGGTGFATYAFSSGLIQVGATNQATGTTAGTYSVTATTALGCSTTATGTITVNPVPALTLSSATICAGQTATLTAGGAGFATYTFSTGLTQVGSTSQATGTTAGTYSVTATTALGCSTTATGTITVNPVPALTLSSATICAGQTATLTAGGTGFATYAFSTGLTQVGSTSQATGTTAGTYSVTATTALGCSTTATGTITVNPVPALTLSSATICAGQTTTLTAGGTGFATYVFSSGLTHIGTTNQATGTTAGTYSVTATTALGCSTTATGSITVNPVPALTLSSATICAGQTATLTAGGAGFATYTFSTGLTQVGSTSQATGTTAGTYSVTATTALGCSTTATGTITVNPVPALTLSSATICAGQTATLTAGGTGFATYAFSTGLTQVGSTSQATGTTAGTYSVTATTALGCSTTATGTITVNPVPALTLSSATICAGQTATLTAGGTGFATYTFSTGLTQVGSTSQATGTTAGTYSVTATTALGCSTTATGTITVNPVPALTLSSATICAGQTATLTAGGTGFATYVFSAGLTHIGATNQATGTTAGTYSVTATTALGCSTTATGTITVNPVPALTLSSATICAGQTATLVAGGTGFATYTFSTGLTQVGSTSQATGTTAGTYSVTATTALGCSTTATGTITVNPVPALTLSSATICAGQTANLTASTGFATYVFSSGLTQVGTSNVASGTAAGTYSVTATTALGCSTTATGTIVSNPTAVVNLTSATICTGQSATLTATAGFSSYIFSSGLTQVGTSNIATGTIANTYSVTATTAFGCSGTATGTITVNPLPVVTLSSATICAGQTAILTATAGLASYVFSANLTQAGTSNVASATAAGTYSVTAINALGCSATATSTITVNPVPVLTLSSATICAGQSATLTAGGTGFATYTFSTGLTQVGATNQATGTTAGTYSVTATTALGCSTTATGTITVNPVPALTLSSATICAGQTATLTAGGTGFATYTFSTGLTQVGSTSQATGTTAGTYSVTATTALGCSTTATGSITVNPVPALTLSSATICAGQTATLTAGGTGFATYVFSTGLTHIGATNQATGTTAGTYSVTATTALGCSTTATGTITVNPVPALTLSSATICAGQTATLVAGGTGFATYTFSTGLTQVGSTSQATGTTAGTYSVTATTALGCSTTGTGSITVNPVPALTLSSATICAGQTATLTAGGTGFATYTFSTGLTQVGSTSQATGTTAGTYSVTATTALGCSTTATGTITVNPVPALTLSSATICAGQTATLTAGGTGFATYAFSTGLTQVGSTSQATGTTAGTYSVTATTALGCSTTATGTITVNPLPALTLSSATICAGQTATLTAGGTGFATYAFSTGLTQVGSTNQATGTTAGTYSVTATTALGCSATATGSITINSNPVVTLSSDTICAGQTAVLSATTGYTTYLFSTGLTQVGTSNVATGIAGGTYSVTAISSAGCSATATGTITVNPLPVVTLSSATICAGQSATLVATPGYASYQFSAGLTPVVGQPNMATGTVDGAYSVTATSVEGCVGTGTGSITVNPNPVVALTSATICAGQTATLTATAGYASYVFSTGLTQLGTSNVAIGTDDGTYSVTAISTEGCSATTTGTITVNPLPIVTLSSVSVCAGQPGVLVATTGYVNYIFSSSLTQVSNSNVATSTVGGIYSVTVVNSVGCSATATGSITVNPLPVVTLSSATICAGQTATLTATAGYASYQFSAGLTPVVGQPNVATGTADGTYSVTVTSADGCVGTGSGTITVNPNPVVTLSSMTVCAGQTASLTATTGYASYVFSAGLTQLGTSNVAIGTDDGTYSVTAISADGCVGTGTGSITINSNPVVTLSSDTICAGQTAVLSATTGYTTYLFSTGLTQVGTSNVATGIAGGTYSVTAISSAGCSATATGTITVNPLPVVTLSSATICAGQSATLVATPGYASYQFSAGLTPVVGQPNMATGTVDGAYSVTATSVEGCVGTGTGSITVNPNPVVALTSATICAGQTATLTATAGYASYVFSTGLTQLGTSNVAIGTDDGTYSVTAISTEGCSATATGIITVNPLPVVTLSSATICAGQSATLVASTGYASYIFSADLTQVGSSSVATGITAGIYSVTAISTEGCSATATGSITVNPNPVVTLSSMTICDGQTASLTATAGYASYIFSAGLTPVVGTANMATGTTDGVYSVTAISTEGCSGTATGSITVNPAVVVTLSSATICAGQVGVLTATAGYDTYIFSTGLTQDGISNVASGTANGTYSVTAISSGGCIGTATGSITVNPTAVVTLSSATICAGQSATLTASPGFANYVFSAGLTPVVGEPNVAIGTVDGIYSVTATSSASCSGSATGSITVNPLPAALITANNTTICQGESTTLTASGGDLYSWSTGEQSASIVVTTSDVYSVTVSTVNGCSDVSSATITVNSLPVITVNSTTVNSGQSATLVVAGCTGGTVLWSTSENTASIVVSPSITTTYSVTCTLSTGCSSTTAATVKANAIPSYTAPPQTDSATCAGAVANNDAKIILTTLLNTERADIVLGSSYGSGPAYGAPTNQTVTAGTVSFLNLPNPGASQPYTIRLYSPGGTFYTDVTVILQPTYCNCPDPKCVPLIIQKTKSARRTAIR